MIGEVVLYGKRGLPFTEPGGKAGRLEKDNIRRQTREKSRGLLLCNTSQ